jgi:hypothetical protein
MVGLLTLILQRRKLRVLFALTVVLLVPAKILQDCQSKVFDIIYMRLAMQRIVIHDRRLLSGGEDYLALGRMEFHHP